MIMFEIDVIICLELRLEVQVPDEQVEVRVHLDEVLDDLVEDHLQDETHEEVVEDHLLEEAQDEVVDDQVDDEHQTQVINHLSSVL
jgi:hypothetical protein